MLQQKICFVGSFCLIDFFCCIVKWEDQVVIGCWVWTAFGLVQKLKGIPECKMESGQLRSSCCRNKNLFFYMVLHDSDLTFAWFLPRFLLVWMANLCLVVWFEVLDVKSRKVLAKSESRCWKWKQRMQQSYWSHCRKFFYVIACFAWRNKPGKLQINPLSLLNATRTQLIE